MQKTVGGFHSIFYVLKRFLRLGPWRLWRSLRSKNACKTCALGMGGQKGGMTNELGRFPEICKKSLQAMQSDMQGAIGDDLWQKFSIAKLKSLAARELEGLGRLTSPLYRRAGDTHFSVLAWDDAIAKIVHKMQRTAAQRSFFYFSGRSSNEAGFLLQIMARLYGTNNVNNCSFYCHQASGAGLTDAIGSGTATVSLDDVENCDLFILLGGNPSSNHPRLMTTLAHLKSKGGRVMVINPVVEPGLVKFKVPSLIRSLFFGTVIADRYVTPHIGGDLALLTGICKTILEKGWEDQSFVQNFTNHFAPFKEHMATCTWQGITENCGVDKAEIIAITAEMVAAKKVIFAWTMGITHHLHGTDTVQSIVNLALLLGMLGKPHCGLLPLRGHSNVQGMGTMGVTPKLKQVLFDNLMAQGHQLPTSPGFDTMACMEAAHAGEIDFAWCLGGNLYESNPDSVYAAESLNKIGMLTHLNTTLHRGHLFAGGEETLILPVLARDEEAQSTTQESMFSFVRLSEGGRGRYKNLRSEVSIIAEIASQILPASPIKWSEMENYHNIREFIAQTIPGLEKINTMEKRGQEFTIPQRILHRPRFHTENQKANFRVLPIPPLALNGRALTMMSVRSEGQFNSVIYEEEDIFRGIDRRNVILMNKSNMQQLQLSENAKVRVKSATGVLENIFVREFAIKEGNALMYYPECNYLISRRTDPRSKTPAFKSTSITVELVL